MQLRNFIWFVLWLGFSAFCIAQPENNFEKANIAYRNGDYKSAAKTYESILADGKYSVDLYFNLGNTYYKLDSLGPSIYYYEKGLQLEPKNKNIQNNLKYAQQATVDEIVSTPQNKITKIFENTVEGLSSNAWAILAIVASAFAAGLFLMYYFTQKPSLKRMWFIVSMFFIVSIFFSLMMSYFGMKLEETNFAIVWEKEIEVRDGPTTNSTHIYYLHEGTKVAITYEEDNWVRIELADGNEGWVQTQDIKKL